MGNKTGTDKELRLVEFYKSLERNGQKSIAQFASEFGVEERTIYKYKNTLEEKWNVKIKYDRREKRYNIIDEGKFAQLAYKSPLKVEDVEVALATLMTTDFFTHEKLNAIRIALKNVLVITEQKKVGETVKKENAILVVKGEVVQAITQAIAESYIVNIHYLKAEFDWKLCIPYALAQDTNKHYLIGYDLKEQMIRHFRLDRIKQCEITGQKGKKDPVFDLEEYMMRTWYMYWGEPTKVVAKFNQCCRDVVFQKGKHITMLEEDDKFFMVEIECNGLEGIKIWLFGFRAKVEVLEPLVLKEQMYEEVEELKRLYEK